MRQFQAGAAHLRRGIKSVGNILFANARFKHGAANVVVEVENAGEPFGAVGLRAAEPNHAGSAGGERAKKNRIKSKVAEAILFNRFRTQLNNAGLASETSHLLEQFMAVE